MLSQHVLGFFPGGGGIGVPEMIIFGIIALLLFGKRLPEVARSLGKGIVEFKKGMSGIEDEIRSAGTQEPQHAPARPSIENDEQEWKAPKFEMPTAEPQAEEQAHA